MKNFALEILKSASAARFNIEVFGEDDVLYEGPDWRNAWEAAQWADGAVEVYIGADGRREWMRVCAHELQPDETVVDSGDDDGWIDREWIRLFEEALKDGRTTFN